MPNIEGGTPAQQTRVQNEINKVLAKLPTQVISVPLERCIKKMAQGDDTIYIGGDECLLSNTLGFTTYYFSFGLKIKSSDVHLCLSNIDRTRSRELTQYPTEMCGRITALTRHCQ